MRRLLRNIKTGEYFLNGKWISNPAEACGFESTKDAIDTALEYRLPDVEVVLQFGPEPSAAYDCHIPLSFSQN